MASVRYAGFSDDSEQQQIMTALKFLIHESERCNYEEIHSALSIAESLLENYPTAAFKRMKLALDEQEKLIIEFLFKFICLSQDQQNQVLKLIATSNDN